MLILQPKSQLILQPFRCFTYVTAHSPTPPLLHLRNSTFSNPSVTSPTSQLILQPFRCFTYVIAHSPTLPLLHLRNSTFSNPSFASPKSEALHLRHLASRPCLNVPIFVKFTLLNLCPACSLKGMFHRSFYYRLTSLKENYLSFTFTIRAHTVRMTGKPHKPCVPNFMLLGTD